MVFVGRKCVYALISFFIFFSGITVFAADHSSSANDTTPQDRFQWAEHAKLSWNDFRGNVNATRDESAAATCCSIGFKTDAPTPGGKQQITVYNTFYVNKSWVRTDARIASILDHEQGHFDLCEIYTRKLRDRMQGIDLSAPGIRETLIRIYTEVSMEYEARQQAYEQETTHGTNIPIQKQWQQAIAFELTRQETVRS